MNRTRSRLLFLVQFRKRFILGSALITAFLLVAPVYATNERAPEIRIFSADKVVLEGAITAFHPNFQGGASIAVGDVDGDGSNELVVGAGPGGGPHVRVLRIDGTVENEFFPYPMTYRGGVNVAVCDFDQDGTDEILLGTRQGGGPLIRIVSSSGEAKLTPGFFAFHRDFRGGVNVACGDVDGDGLEDIIAGVGIGAHPAVRIFDRYGKTKNLDIIPFASRDRGGVDVATANVDGGAEKEIIVSLYRFGRPLVKVYKADSSRTIVGSFEGWPEESQGGFHVTGGDVDGDGFDEVIVSIGNGGGPQVRAFEAYGKSLPQNFFAYEADFRGGVNVSVGDVDNDGSLEIVTAPDRNTIQGRVDLQKYIEVRLGEQRLYAYDNGFVKRTFLISSGVNKYPTPEGTFSVTAKIPKKDYEWTYGPDHPDNYDLKDVEFNLRFAPTFYLHYAYWHNNFGRKMSHGCVNINRVNSQWLYDWADLGIPVIVHK